MHHFWSVLFYYLPSGGDGWRVFQNSTHIVNEQGDQIGLMFAFGRLFTLGSFWKTTEVAQIFVILFFLSYK
jgi:hypothetical protein